MWLMPGQCCDHTGLVVDNHTAEVVVESLLAEQIVVVADPAVQVTVEADHEQVAVQVDVQDGVGLPDVLEIVAANPDVQED